MSKLQTRFVLYWAVTTWSFSLPLKAVQYLEVWGGITVDILYFNENRLLIVRKILKIFLEEQNKLLVLLRMKTLGPALHADRTILYMNASLEVTLTTKKTLFCTKNARPNCSLARLFTLLFATSRWTEEQIFQTQPRPLIVLTLLSIATTRWKINTTIRLNILQELEQSNFLFAYIVLNYLLDSKVRFYGLFDCCWGKKHCDS